MLVDELINIEINLASLSQSPLNHRTFACFLKVTGEENYIKVTPANLSNALNKVDNNGKAVLQLWFKQGGTNLTVYSNDLKYLKTLEFMPEHNIIFAANSPAEQLAIYNSLISTQVSQLPETIEPGEISDIEVTENNGKKTIIATKRINVKDRLFLTKSTNLPDSSPTVVTSSKLVDKFLYFTVDNEFNVENYPKGRGIFAILSNPLNNDLGVFEYLAAYTIQDYYCKNNFESSSLQGSELTTLSFLTQNNLGALIYFPEFKESKFYNMVDLAGFGLNRSFLNKDLEHKAKNRCLTALANGNTYNDNTLAKLDNVIASCADFYVNNNLIASYVTSYLPKAKQQVEDTVQGIAKGFKLIYKPMDEVKKMHINLSEGF